MTDAAYMRLYNKRKKEEQPEKHRREREARNLKGKVKRAELRRSILEILGPRCATCGYCHDVRALQIDHIGGGGEKHRKAKGHETYYRDILSEIVAGSRAYQILCANCNSIKKFELGE